MGDKETLDLIEYYNWPIVWFHDNMCVIVTKGGSTKPQTSIRKAVSDAISLQAAWAMSG